MHPFCAFKMPPFFQVQNIEVEMCDTKIKMLDMIYIRFCLPNKNNIILALFQWASRAM
jgi:hypothetical protein